MTDHSSSGGDLIAHVTFAHGAAVWIVHGHVVCMGHHILMALGVRRRGSGPPFTTRWSSRLAQWAATSPQAAKPNDVSMSLTPALPPYTSSHCHVAAGSSKGAERGGGSQASQDGGAGQSMQSVRWEGGFGSQIGGMRGMGE